MQMDEEVGSISSDALKVTAKATELVVHMLAVKACKVSTDLDPPPPFEIHVLFP